jgi:hypothetical protein
MGWDNQMPGDVLLNINAQFEKMIWQPAKALELMAGGQVQAGTMLDGASAHIQFRAGKMQPYFDSYTGQFSSSKGRTRGRLQYYFFFKPAIQWWGYNALLEGGVFAGKSDYYAGVNTHGQSPSLKRVTATADVGLVLVTGNVSLSFIQKEMSPLIHDVSDQSIGNISLTFTW